MRRLAVGVVMVATASVACGGDTDGEPESIDVFGPYLGSEADAFVASLRGFEQATDARVRYTGSGDFESDLRARVEGGVDEPDLAVVPQPGLIAQFATDGELVDFDADTLAAVDANFAFGAENVMIPGGGSFLPYRASVKSVVWYRPDVLAEHGWAIPATLDDLATLVDDVADTDGAPDPWCFSVFSGSATGWPATDWIEDLVLRRAGTDVYDGWVTGRIAFDSDEVRQAFTEFEELVLEPGRSAGGLRSILQTEVREAGTPLFADPPGCVLYKQASFATSWFPDGVEIGPDGDVDFFVLPATDGAPAPVVRAGDSVVQFTDREIVHDLVAHLATPAGASAWAEVGGYVSRRTSVDVDEYYEGADARFAELLLGDRTSRFDGSDVMPPDIGSDLLWEQITMWIAGTRSLDELVETLDEAYADRVAGAVDRVPTADDD